ncbi:MAG: RNA polymerase sigma factor (sigma-70 family) [Planctomycetota bacterium]|jgi:RNA polymerase sigma factor (sigma-70 family)
MSQSPGSNTDGKSEVVPVVCVSCRFGTGPDRECSLILDGNLTELLSEGPCQLDRHIRSRLNIIMRRNFPLVTDHADDLFQEAIMRLLGPGLAFPGQLLKTLPALRRWLPRFLRNQVIDYLRHQKVITRLRCGACENFSRNTPQRCQLEFITEDGGELVPNPWWGDRVSPSTDPRRLDPSCSEFVWRRPATFDIFDEEAVGKNPAASKSEEAARVCLLAIDRLSVSSERGMREAAVIAAHYFSKRRVADLATRSSVSEKTIKRLLSTGRKSLLTILQKEFGLDSPGDLLS